MNPMRPNLRLIAIYGTLSMLLLLSACFTLTETPPAAQLLLVTPVQIDVAALTQQKNDADHQTAVAAEVVRANAQATLNSANATLGAVQTQQQNDANVIAITAEIARANALATLNSAGSTQNAALTQDAIRQTQMADLATTGAQAVVNQQYRNELAAGTQTAIAYGISTQAQFSIATSQQYARQREEQRQGPITFVGTWCLPMFIVLLAGLVLWGLWRRLQIQQDNLRILEKPVDRLPALAVEVPHHHHAGSLPYLDSEIADDGYQVTNPDDQVEQWLDEVKDQLLDREEKDKDDNPDD